MPFYFSKKSVIDRYGEEFVLFNADRDSDQDLDQDAVDRGIRDAEAEVNSYVAKCYVLPLPGVTDIADPESNTFVPHELRRVGVDIFVYRMSPQHDRLTKEKRKRYDDAIAWLKMLAEKKVSLTVGSVPSSGGVTREGPDRIFTRDTQSGLV